MTIRTGVIQTNHAAWLYEELMEYGVMLNFETYRCEVGDDEEALEAYESDVETILSGFTECDRDDPDAWFKTDCAAWKLDPEAEFSAITTEIYTQIVRSRWVTYGAMCSPCFPNQVDLGSDGPYLGYTLPPDMFDKQYDDSKYWTTTIQQVELESEEGEL